MSHAIPVFATSRDPAALPVGDLLAEVFWVTPGGLLGAALGSVPVQNGVAIVDGTLPPAGFLFAIRIQQSATLGLSFAPGPGRRRRCFLVVQLDGMAGAVRR